MRPLLVFVLLVLIAVPVSAGADTRREFEEAARELSFFAFDDFLYNRDVTSRVAADNALRYSATLSELVFARREIASRVFIQLGGGTSSRDVSVLLRHPNPKVRTLAMAWLFAQQRHRALPLLKEHVDDRAKTFPALQPTALIYLPGHEPSEPPLRTQRVGDVARGMLAFYMERAGYYYGTEGKDEHGGFDEYWEVRSKRAHCLSWFAVKLDRATEGVSPLLQRAVSKVSAVRQQVDALSPVEREVALLSLFVGRADLRDLIPERDLVFAGRRLGPERLLTLLRGEPLVDDPDLPHYLDSIQSFVLQHASEMLRPADADWLLERGRETRKADWFLAAAEVRPKSASKILREAFQACDFLGDERTRTATALWRLTGPGHEGFLVDWFFRDDEPKMGRTPYRAGLVDFLTERFSVADRSLLAWVVRDIRFEQLDWGTLEILIKGLNRNLLHPVVSSKELDGTRHPMGKSHVYGMMERAREEYPAETAQLLTTLKSWRERVRERLVDWEPVAQ
jgi:hypothetical protein